MGLFRARPGEPSAPTGAVQGHPLPKLQIDFTKRYDVYLQWQCEERLYENVQFVAIRSFEPPEDWRTSLGSFYEIEAVDGTRMMVPTIGIQLVVEHGVKPAYRVVRQWNSW